jgi:hypothetical protein
MTRTRLLHIAVIPLFALLAVGSSSKPSADDKTSTTETTAATIGTPVMVGDAEWTIIDVVNRGSTMKPHESFDKDATTAGTFLQVHFKVRNNGKKEGTMGEVPKLVDDTGREFGTFLSASSYRPVGTNGVFLDPVQPSLTKEFTEIYELPTGVKSVAIKAHDFGVFSKEKKIGLGNVPAAPPPPAATPTQAAQPAPKAATPAAKAKPAAKK